MTRTKVLLTLSLTAGLLLSVAWLRDPFARLAADHWRGQFDSVPDYRAWVLLEQVGELGRPGIPVLVEALGSDRESVARAAKRVLLQQLDDWEVISHYDRSRNLAVLADALADRVEQFGPTARADANELATRILSCPLDRRAVDRVSVIASCEMVLDATAIDGDRPPVGPPVGQRASAGALTDLPDIRPFAIDGPGQFDVSVGKLAGLPGGGLSPLPDSPTTVDVPMLAEVSPERPRRLVAR